MSETCTKAEVVARFLAAKQPQGNIATHKCQINAALAAVLPESEPRSVG